MEKDPNTREKGCSSGSCRLDVITPLAKKINCLDVKRIADICIHESSGSLIFVSTKFRNSLAPNWLLYISSTKAVIFSTWKKTTIPF
jgi:hypothetical protein